MNGTMRRLLGRSVQLAVLATPTASVVDAVAEARRRHDAAVSLITDVARTLVPPPTAPGAAAA